MRINGPLFAILGAGSLWIAWLMQNERRPRNGLVGMRTSATMASDAAWKASHRASAWSVAVTGVILLAAGLWLLLTRQSASDERTVLNGACIAVLVVLVVGGVQAHRVAKGTTSASSS
jgi:uncharacterized membrane protein